MVAHEALLAEWIVPGGIHGAALRLQQCDRAPQLGAIAQPQSEAGIVRGATAPR